LTVLNVNHSVRSPKMLEGVWHARQLAGKLHPRLSHF